MSIYDTPNDTADQRLIAQLEKAHNNLSGERTPEAKTRLLSKSEKAVLSDLPIHHRLPFIRSLPSDKANG